jgi:hypothetical protein
MMWKHLRTPSYAPGSDHSGVKGTIAVDFNGMSVVCRFILNLPQLSKRSYS